MHAGAQADIMPPLLGVKSQNSGAFPSSCPQETPGLHEAPQGLHEAPQGLQLAPQGLHEAPTIMEYNDPWDFGPTMESLDQDVSKESSSQDHESLFNSGVPAFGAGTMLISNVGIFPIEDVVGRTVDLFDGREFVRYRVLRYTHKTTVDSLARVEISFSNGTTLSVTPSTSFVLVNPGTNQTEFCQAVDLQAGVSHVTANSPVQMVSTPSSTPFPLGPYVGGLYAGFGYVERVLQPNGLDTIGRSVICLRDFSYDALQGIPRNFVHSVRTSVYSDEISGFSRVKDVVLNAVFPTRNNIPLNSDLATKIKWLSGLLDSCGGYDARGFEIYFLTDSKKLAKDLPLFLWSLGVFSSCEKNRYTQLDAPEYRVSVKERGLSRLLCLGLKPLTFTIQPRNLSSEPFKAVDIVTVTKKRIITNAESEDLYLLEPLFKLTSEKKSYMITVGGIRACVECTDRQFLSSSGLISQIRDNVTIPRIVF